MVTDSMGGRHPVLERLPQAVADAYGRGQSVIPMAVDKTPLVKWKEYQQRQPTREELGYWLFEFGERIAGWARVTGALAGVIVLDDDGAGWLDRFDLRPHVRTGSGGHHWIGRHPGWRVKTLNSKSCRRLAETYPGLDIRGDGGYSLIAGFNQKGGYTWLRDAEPDPLILLPREVREFFGLLAPPGPARRTSTARPALPPDANGRVQAELLVARALAEARASGRNNAGFWLALQLRDNGYSRAEAEELGAAYVTAVGPANMKGDVEPYTREDYAESVSQAYSQPAREAWAERGAGQEPRRRPGAAAAPAVATPISLAALLGTFQRWLYLPDTGQIEVTLGAFAGNCLPGEPVWLMDIGAPGSGKTELLIALSPLPHVVFRSSLSGEASLLSGTTRRDRPATATGGLLQEIGSFGVLVLKDFTTLLSMRPDQRGPLLAALREVFDGSYTRSVGVDGGRTLSWSGKLGLLAGCTPIIDSHHAVIGSMGERFVFYRLPPAEAEQQADRALDHAGEKVQAMRAELAKAVAGLFAGITEFSETALSGEERRRLVDLAVLAVRCRSAVERDGRSREIELIPDPEAPARLAGVLYRLFAGMIVVGVERERAWQLLARVCAHSMPALRWSLLRRAADSGEGEVITTSAFVQGTRYPTMTVRRGLEDLHAHGILARVQQQKGCADLWALDEWAREKWERLARWLEHEGPFPKNR